jgi:hypothetical protein
MWLYNITTMWIYNCCSQLKQKYKMKFKIINDLSSGRYFVKAELTELTENDKEKAEKFGFPQITIKLINGKEAPVRITQLNRIDSYGFYNQEEADEYSNWLKTQIIDLKDKWSLLKDSWSKEEEL